MLYCYEVIYNDSKDFPELFYGEGGGELIIDKKKVNIVRYTICVSAKDPQEEVHDFMLQFGSIKSFRTMDFLARNFKIFWRFEYVKCKIILFTRKLTKFRWSESNLIIFGISPPIGFESNKHLRNTRSFFDKSV